MNTIVRRREGREKIGMAKQLGLHHAFGTFFRCCFPSSSAALMGDCGKIGVLVMVHSDNQGLVLPPRVAPVQVLFLLRFALIMF